MIKRVYLEITDSCNLNCPFCTNEKGTSFMSFIDIKDHLIKVKEVCDYIYLHVLGEPLLHPDFESILNECDKLNLKVQLVTNGTLLNKHKNLLKHSCIRKLSISIHSVNNIKVDKDYFINISDLIKNNQDKTIELRFYNKENLNEDISTYLKDLYLKYQVKDTDRFNSYKLKDNVYITYSDMFNWPSIFDPFISNNGKCLGALNQIAILHDSRVTLCCLDPKGYNTIGNLKNNTLKDIVESKEYISISNNFRNNKLSKELCTKCSYRLRFDDRSN